MIEIPTPCKEEVEKYLKKWEEDETISLHDSSLKLLFEELFPENKKKEHILIKVNTLNDFYSAGVLNKEIIPLTEHIYKKLDFDEKLKKGDSDLVDYIMNAKDVRKVYSFATKYCSHHNPEEFPIFDSYVKKVLKHFRDKNPSFNFKNDELNNYKSFKDILTKFKNEYDLDEYGFKELDMYLWQLGKDYF